MSVPRSRRRPLWARAARQCVRKEVKHSAAQRNGGPWAASGPGGRGGRRRPANQRAASALRRPSRRTPLPSSARVRAFLLAFLWVLRQESSSVCWSAVWVQAVRARACPHERGRGRTLSTHRGGIPGEIGQSERERSGFESAQLGRGIWLYFRLAEALCLPRRCRG